MPVWSPFFSYPDLTYDAGWTGGINFDVVPIQVADPDFTTACDTTSEDTGPDGSPWNASSMLWGHGLGDDQYRISQFFVHLDFRAFVAQRRNDGPDYPYPYPDNRLAGWGREGTPGVFEANSAPFADIAAEFNRFRFSFDVTDDSQDLIDFNEMTPVDVSIWVKPWLPADLTYVDPISSLLSRGSWPLARFASATELAAAGNWVTSGGSLPAGTDSTTVVTADMLPSDYLDLVDHPEGTVGVAGDEQFLCFTIAIAAQVSHTNNLDPVVRGRRITVDNVNLDAQWARDRFRFQFKVPPPLRQRPARDDYVGGEPRQGRTSRSVQASARQGWSGCYR